MARYRRAYVPGATYFFTVNLANRAERLLVEYVDPLRLAFAETMRRLPFEIQAIVILPDHLHCVWTLPPGDSDFSMRWRLVKTRFSCAIDKQEPVSASRAWKGERGIWQRRFWEHLIRDDGDYNAHLAYIHFNPVKHGHVRRPRDWPYSSFHRFVRAGLYPQDWAGDEEVGGLFGEMT